MVRNVARNYPKARKHSDYRKMFDAQKDIDAVVVSSPDHHHAPASLLAMNLGKHAYCEKPLTHSVYEARLMAAAAKKNKVATRMGNAGHAGPGVRAVVEALRAGILGKVTECHARNKWATQVSPLRQAPRQNSFRDCTVVGVPYRLQGFDIGLLRGY